MIESDRTYMSTLLSNVNSSMITAIINQLVDVTVVSAKASTTFFSVIEHYYVNGMLIVYPR